MQRSRPPVHSFPAFGLSSAGFWFLAAALILSGLPLAAQKHFMPARGMSASIQVHGDSMDLPGLSVQLTPQGFPQQLQVIHSPDVADPPSDTTNLLAENIHFHFTRLSDGKDIRLTTEGLHFTMRKPEGVRWKATATSEELRMEVDGAIDSAGLLSYSVSVTAQQDLELKDITFHIPLNKEVSGFMAGLGVHGERPDSVVVWPWSIARRHERKTWIGERSAGLLFYLSSTHADLGKGGIAVGIKGKSMLINDYAGASTVEKGTCLFYNFTLHITHRVPVTTTFVE